ncbi:hypothetical protein EXIGLDRAFT_842555 [Exidia glandulosa HHB12029]|uniref:Uncharacterized protein n=1 Tax=Exidia glandulosa HHB12029 TaxID=1314781 RepID=A0A165D8A5_EXIGL|nr:hypothetical protein EXIGLDRAFT_842555 [Exidia glandulosa HHB12029]
MSTLDPNRFAGPAEAALLRDDIAADEAARAALRERAKRAQTALHDANEAVRAAQEAAASAQQSVDHITQLEHVVDKRLAVSRGLLHPIRRLPDELLAMIFTWRPIFFSISRPVPCLPFVLAAVCRRWRRVALSTPVLWDTLSCSIKDFRDIEAERSYASYLRYYLVRSSNIPLSISVVYKARNCAARGPLWLAISELYRRAQTFSFSSYHDCDCKASVEAALNTPVYTEPDSYREVKYVQV